MSGFKLVGIRPLAGCYPKFLKVLKENHLYLFYSDYSFDFSEDKIEVTHKRSIPEGLFDISGVKIEEDRPEKKRIIHTNLSCIVGKNGSGKSTLLELYYLSMYFLAIHRKEPFLEPNLNTINAEIQKLESKADLKDLSKIKMLTLERENIIDIISGLKVQLFYEVNNTLYMVDTTAPKIDEEETDFISLIYGATDSKRDFLLSTLFDDAEKYDPSTFAYSCVINYSIHGLNSSNIGNWIQTLFHKNDSYHTPIVINPMRTNGDFEMSHENNLLQGRMMLSVVDSIRKGNKESIKALLGTGDRIPKYIVFSLRQRTNIEGFRTKKDSSYELLDQEIQPLVIENGYLTFIETLSKHFNLDFSGIAKSNTLLKYCLQYSFGKLKRIKEKYPEFYGSKLDSDYILALIDDTSHISLKFRQAVYFVSSSYFQKLKSNFFEDVPSNNELVQINPEEFEKKVMYKLEDINSEFDLDKDILLQVPPAIFNIDYQFSEEINDTLSHLSSGESQSSHSLNAIYYHVRNIDSMNKDELGFSYSHINLILDEIELYSHPEMQRTFISRLLKGLDALQLRKIESINIILATHSPFILSDVPQSNVMQLYSGKQNYEFKMQTFGANIADLFKQPFFLNEGFMGAHAQGKIEKTIQWLTNDQRLLSEKEMHLELIKLIGEPILKLKLAEMYDQITGNKTEEQMLEERLNELRNKKR